MPDGVELIAAEPITEDWLRACGFKWEQHDRQQSKHWLLWLGWALSDPNEGRAFADAHDLGIELAHNDNGEDFWYCWVRADYCNRYNRFLHVRHMAQQREVVALIEALTGRPFVPSDSMYGCLRTPEDAARLKRESELLHMRVAKQVGQNIDRANDADPAKIEIV
jgi:hypothetical protein